MGGACSSRTQHQRATVGWHIDRVRFVGVAAKWRKVCPTANFLVRYTKKETNGELTEGLEEARELSAANYGCDEWWLLLDPVQEAEAGGSS